MFLICGGQGYRVTDKFSVVTYYHTSNTEDLRTYDLGIKQ